MRVRTAVVAAVTIVVAALATPARAQVIPARVMVLVDTSGSMLYYFANNLGTGGEGDASSTYRDALVGPVNWYPGNAGTQSRMYAAKHAVTAVINASANIDFGLMRYAVASTCPDPVRNCCLFGSPRCFNGIGTSSYSDASINWHGGCGPLAMIGTSTVATDGGQILVQPGGGNLDVLQWVDGNEDFRDRGDGWPVDGELRAAGTTPIAGALRTALNGWYAPVYNVSKAGAPGYDPTSPLFDPQLDCRPYVMVAMTDGGDSCDSASIGGPLGAVNALHGQNAQNPVLTYVIGLGIASSGDVSLLNRMAAAGGTVAARFATSETDIEAAFADISAASVKVEQCNGRDDNCNGAVDEGFGVGAPCSLGVGACLRTGVKKCDPADATATTCCVDDGKAACTALAAGAPQPETCNGIDDNCDGIVDDGGVCASCRPTPEVCDGMDNDCNGWTDDGPVDVGKPCGLTLGTCLPGVTVCVSPMGATFPDAGDHIECSGGVGPQAESCNGLDDDCDGVVDGMSRRCYDGPAGSEGIGRCLGGDQRCDAAVWGACVGEVLPGSEICNGVDDDCNGVVDDVASGGVTAGEVCCPSGRCGTGPCLAGTWQCSGGALDCVGGVGPQPETCNGLDDDCSGLADDLSSIGNACMPASGCYGRLECDLASGGLVCTPAAGGGPEMCNGLDDDCDGVVDEPAEVSANDPAVGAPCGNARNLPLPCHAGAGECHGGRVVCEGAVGPLGEVCDCQDNDCNGIVDDGAPCPGGTACHACGCYASCAPGEFACPGGYECDADNFCVPARTCDPPCAAGFECREGTCVDRCATVNCPPQYACVNGVCIDVSCVAEHPCARCERCDHPSRTCVLNPCCDAQCGAGTYCDPFDGRCVHVCGACAVGERCVDGSCQPSPCGRASCPQREACDPRSGACVPDPCQGVACDATQVCVAGACADDLCPLVRCPDGYRCHTDPFVGTHTCDRLPTPAPEQVVGAGSGGLACAAAPGSRPPRAALALLAGLAVIACRRRRRRA